MKVSAFEITFNIGSTKSGQKGWVWSCPEAKWEVISSGFYPVSERPRHCANDCFGFGHRSALREILKIYLLVPGVVHM